MFGRRHLVVLAVLAFVVAACGGDDDGGSADASTIHVRATSFAFEPAEIEIPAGEEVTIELTSTDIEHDFVVERVEGMDGHTAHAGHTVHADAGHTERGTMHIDEPGEYTFYCSIPGHRAAGMEGRLVVAE